MAHDGTGTGWDIAAPANGDLLSNAALEIRDLRKGVGIRNDKEHAAEASSSAGGEHKAGSAKTYWAVAASAPTKRPDTTTNLDASDAGRLFIESDTLKLKVWNGTSMVNVIPRSSKYAKIVQTQGAGVNGGTLTANTWNTRTLNLTEIDADSLVTSLTTNAFTLPAGKYRIKAILPVYGGTTPVAGHQSRLYNVTDSSIVLSGSVGYAGVGMMDNSFINGEFTLAATKTLRIEHNCEGVGGASAQGRGTTFTSAPNSIYAQVEIWKVPA